MIITCIELKFKLFPIYSKIFKLIELARNLSFSSQVDLLYGKIVTIRNEGESKWNHIWLESSTLRSNDKRRRKFKNVILNAKELLLQKLHIATTKKTAQSLPFVMSKLVKLIRLTALT